MITLDVSRSEGTFLETFLQVADRLPRAEQLLLRAVRAKVMRSLSGRPAGTLTLEEDEAMCLYLFLKALKKTRGIQTSQVSMATLALLSKRLKAAMEAHAETIEISVPVSVIELGMLADYSRYILACIERENDLYTTTQVVHRAAQTFYDLHQSPEQDSFLEVTRLTFAIPVWGCVSALLLELQKDAKAGRADPDEEMCLALYAIATTFLAKIESTIHTSSKAA